MKRTNSAATRWLASLNSIALLLALAFGAATTAHAASGTWNVDAAGNWSAAANWNPAAVPGIAAGDVVGLTYNITAARAVTIDTTSRTVGTLNIGDPTTAFFAYTLAASGGAHLTFDNSGSGAKLVQATTTASDIISAPLTLADNLSVNNSSTLTLSGIIGDGGAGKTITKTGTGTLTLTGANTYSGTTTVSAGTLSFNNIGLVGAASSALGAPTTSANGTIGLAGTLLYTGAATTSDRIINLTGGGIVNNGGSGLLTLSGGITGVNVDITFRGAQNITETGIIATGSGRLQRTDAGTVTLNNAANSFSGVVNGLAGTISINSISDSGMPSALGQGTSINLGQTTSFGTLQFTGGSGECNRAISVTGNGTTGGGIIENTLAGRTLILSGNVGIGTGTPLLQLIGTGNGQMSGVISGSGLAITKSGTGTWTLSGANTYSGTTTISQGTLAAGVASVANTSGAFGLNTAVILANTAGAKMDLNGFDTQIGSLAGGGLAGGNVNLEGNTLTVGANSTSTTYAGVVSDAGGGALTKIGTGTLSLSRAHTYSGATTVSAGKLVGVTGGSLSSDVTVSSGATLGVQVLTSDSQWSCSSLTLNSGTTTNEFNFYSAAPSTTTAPLLIYGNLVNNGTLNVNIVGGVIGAGTYPLIQYYGTLTVGTLGAVTMANGAVGTLVNNTGNGTIDLNVITGASAIVWNGGTGNWDINTTANWMGGLKYLDGNAVLFDDTSSGTAPFTVTLATTVNPANVAVNNPTKNYTISGAGAIGGGTSLIKSGAGSLTLSGTNTYSGVTTINGGSLTISGSGSLGGGAYAGAITIAGGTSFTNNSSVAQALSGVISGDGSFSKSGTGSLALSGANTYTGPTFVTAGIVTVSTPTAFGTADAGTTVGGAGEVDVPAGGSTAEPFTFYTTTGNGNLRPLNSSITFSGPITLRGDARITGAQLASFTGPIDLGSFNLNFNLNANSSAPGYNISGYITGAGGSLTINSAGSAHVISGANDYTGGTIINAGVVKVGYNTYALGTGVVTVNSGGQLDLNGWTPTVGGLSGTSGGLITNTYPGVVTLTVDSTNATTYAGSIKDGGAGNAISISKSSSGVQTLTGNNNYSGTTTVAAGTLALGTVGAATNSVITVSDGATLGVVVTAAGTTFTPANLTVGSGSGATINCVLGNLGSLTAPLIAPGLLTVNGTLTFNVSCFSAGQFPLLKHASAASIPTALGPFPRGIAHLFTNLPNNSIDLVVDSVVLDTKWVGNHGPNWDINTTVNWTNSLAGITTYQEPSAPGEPVRFDDTAVTGSVNLTTTLSPAAVTVSNSVLNYTFSGPGAIAGATALTKGGSATLTVASPNTYSGGTLINGGTVSLGNGGTNGALGTGSITNNGTLVVNQTNTTTLTQLITGPGGLTKLGTNTLTLSQTNTYTGGTIVSNGIIGFGVAGVSSGTNIISSATGLGNVTLANGVTIAQNNTGNANAWWFANTVTLAGDITLPGNNRQFVGIKMWMLTGGTRTIHLNPTAAPVMSTVTGNTLTAGGSGSFQATDISDTHPFTDYLAIPWTIQNGNLALDSNLTGNNYGTFFLQFPTSFTNNVGLTVGPNVLLITWLEGGLGSNTTDTAKLTLNGIWNLEGNVSPPVWGTNHTVYSLAGSGKVYGAMVATTSPRTLTINGTAGSTTFSGALADGPGPGALSLAKTGASTQILSGTNTYTGNTSVSGGTLTLASTGSLQFAIGANGVNNGISGTGTVNLNGTFNFNLSGAGTNVGNNWTVVNVGSLSTTFGGYFSVAGFANAGGGLWTATNNGARYQFSQATGGLSVVPAPTVSQPTISSVQYTGSSLILSGTNGTTSGGYSVRSSTNAALAVANWPVLTTGTFGALGQFSVTNAVNPAEPQRFYLISQP